MQKTKSVIIVAGGKGLRMGQDIPKQFIPIGGKPVLMHTIETFYNYDDKIEIILVLSPDYFDYWQKLRFEYTFTIPHQITHGGETRFHSVKNGLEMVKNDIVAVHDAARPFASKELIEKCFEEACIGKAVIPALDATDSLREMTDDLHSKIIDRNKIKLVQTPQVFLTDVLRKAYNQEYIQTFTDDASVVESIGENVLLVKGETSNIKITTPFDLEVAKLLIRDKK